MTDHFDENGKPCTRHAVATDGLLAWAAVGSRISGFHHDTASKLQSLMMALDEATELLGDDRPDLMVALQTATTSMKEMHALLSENRALAKAPQRKPTQIAELLKRAAARHGVKLIGEVGPMTAHVAPPSIVHALALVLDLSAGSLHATRAVTVTATPRGDDVVIDLVGQPVDPTKDLINESVAVAAFLLAREDGELRCSPKGFVVQLPTTLRSAAVKP
jgi:hypothetical protein